MWCSCTVIKGCDTKLQSEVPKVLKYEPPTTQPIVSRCTDYTISLFTESLIGVSAKKLKKNKNLTFSIPCITVQLLQFQPTNAHNCIRFTVILQKPVTGTHFRLYWPVIREYNSCVKWLLNIAVCCT